MPFPVYIPTIKAKPIQQSISQILSCVLSEVSCNTFEPKNRLATNDRDAVECQRLAVALAPCPLKPPPAATGASAPVGMTKRRGRMTKRDCPMYGKLPVIGIIPITDSFPHKVQAPSLPPPSLSDTSPKDGDFTSSPLGAGACCTAAEGFENASFPSYHKFSRKIRLTSL